MNVTDDVLWRKQEATQPWRRVESLKRREINRGQISSASALASGHHRILTVRVAPSSTPDYHTTA